MRAFQVLTGVLFVAIVVYTGIVGASHGWDLLPIFFGDILAMTWPGQFNFDFMSFLLLTGLWVSWRHHFSAGGVALGLVALFGGMMFFSVYLFFACSAADGDAAVLLLGKERATAQR